MSTRANITIDTKRMTPKGDSNRVWLYHHWDGYPSWLGVELGNFLKENGNPANIWEGDNIRLANKLIKRTDDDGYELTCGQHGDIEFLYQIDTDAKTIKVLAVDFWTVTDKAAATRELFSANYADPKSLDEWIEWCKEH